MKLLGMSPIGMRLPGMRRTKVPLGPWCSLALAALAILVASVGVHAQTSDLSIEVGGSSVSPPAGIEGEDARFVVAGIRALHFKSGGSGALASFLVGRTLKDGAGGDFLSGIVEGQALKHFGEAWSAGVELRGFGFRVADPFPYRSFGVEGGPAFRFTSRYVSAALKGIAGGGWSETELRRTGERPSQVVEDELWRYGGTGEVLAGDKGFLTGIALGVHESSGGSYRSAGIRLLATRGGSALELRLDAWNTPSGAETTGGLAFNVPFGGWSVRGFMGRTEPDPLTLAEPGGGSGGILVGRRLFGRDPLSPAKAPLYRVLEQTGRAATVEIHVDAPGGTGQMELMGDFTFWEPVPMEHDGSRWSIQLAVPIGIHHFGFLADGEWYLPEDTPDAVPDDWGRRNATMVIEG
jgi:hypothetical protein